jgi:aspartate aminotransferase
MGLSKIGRNVGESATLRLNKLFSTLKASGEPVIHLGGGEPFSKAPKGALDAVSEFLKAGYVRYAPADGTPDMKKAVINYTRDNYERSFEPANIVVSGGAKQAIMIALQAVLDPMDEVIFPLPYWVSYPDMVRLCGAIPVPVKPADGSLCPTIEDIAGSISSKTKAIIINSPNNPAGTVYSRDFIRDIVRFAEKKGIYLIMDDIYHKLVFSGIDVANPYEYAEDTGENSKLIIVNGVSKAYAMTGFRIGWAVGNKALIKAMANIQGHQTSGPSILGQIGAIAAINGDQSVVKKLASSLEANKKVMMEYLQRIDRIRIFEPQGTFYTFSDFSAYEKDSAKMSEFLLEKAQVLTVPGKEFGMDGFLRISYCGETDDIVTGLERVKSVLDSYSA